MHVSKTTGQRVDGSPLNVTAVEPRFREYHLVEKNHLKAEHLKSLFASNADVTVHEGDCNVELPKSLLPKVHYKDYRRAFCLLDPYGLHLAWSVVEQAGRLGTVDLLLNFPTMDMNMNALLHDRDKVRSDQAERMTRFWGDESWRVDAVEQDAGLFAVIEKKAGNEAVVQAYCKRLADVAGFKHVAQPLAMRNTTHAVVYYLVFASQNATAHKIITSIFNKQRKD